MRRFAFASFLTTLVASVSAYQIHAGAASVGSPVICMTRSSFSDDFDDGTVDSAFSALGDATLSESNGLLHVTVTNSGGVKFTAPTNGCDALKYELIPNFSGSGGYITESEYVKDGNSGTPDLGYGTKYDNATDMVYFIQGDGSGGDVLEPMASLTNNEPILTTRKWKYNSVFGVAIGCYTDGHIINWLPPFGGWTFGTARSPDVTNYTDAQITSVEITGTASFDLEVFGIDGNDLSSGDIESSPTTGSTTGGTTVTVDAWGDVQFVNVSNVKLDGVAVSYTVVSSSRLTYQTPAHASGVVSFEFQADATDNSTWTYKDMKAFKYQ